MGIFSNNKKITSFNEFKYFNVLNLGAKGNSSPNTVMFDGCSELKEISIPESIKIISYTDGTHPGAFLGCVNLEKVHIPSTDWLVTLNNSGNGNGDLPAASSYLTKYFVNDELVTDIVISDNITSINGGRPFYKYSYLETITGNNVTKIPGYCFAECVNLKEANFPLLTNLSYNNTVLGCAFMGCKSLESFTLNSNVTTIPPSTFQLCSNFKNINTENVITIGQTAFSQCSNLEYIDLSSCKTIGATAFYLCPKLNNINTENVTSVGLMAFRGCSSLEKLDLSGLSIDILPSHLCTDCTNLKEVKISDTIKNIQMYAFANCSNLKIDELPKNLTTVGLNAFSLATLNIIEFPKTCTFVDREAFYNCNFPNLTSISSISFKNSLWAFRNAKMPLLIFKYQDEDVNIDFPFLLASMFYYHTNKVTRPLAVMNSTTFSSQIFICGKYVLSLGEAFRMVNGTKAYIIELGYSGSIPNPNGDYFARELVDIPETAEIPTNMRLGFTHEIKNIIMRKIDAQWQTSAYCRRMFTPEGYTGSHNSSTVMCLIGGTEWVEYMKELNTEYDGYRFNRCTNVTETGYISTYDNQFHPWSDEWADYDIFGVDRPETPEPEQ